MNLTSEKTLVIKLNDADRRNLRAEIERAFNHNLTPLMSTGGPPAYPYLSRIYRELA